ncbi:Flp family type IVb pilin [Shinella sp. BYT-45]|uniref:Flp family type IVb pilin n=1 Tax=Shinella sp. BYT-45 TaxID=3377377 RepID=UPI00397EADB7
MMTRLLKSFLADASGATAVEYGLLAVLVSVGMLVGLTAFSDSLNNTFMLLSNKIEPK